MELTYQVVRSTRRKKLTITVERDRTVVVHAPAKTTDLEIRDVIDAKRAWLFEKINHVQKYQDRPHAPGKEVVNGESALYLGREYRITLAETASGKIEFAQGFVVPRRFRTKSRENLRAWYLERAQAVILPRVTRYAAELGSLCAGANIVDSRYRWGSCTPKNEVNFNWRLIKAPMFVIDYVIVHELAHFLETNHTPRFWTVVHAKCPRAEQARCWLKEHGQLLEVSV